MPEHSFLYSYGRDPSPTLSLPASSASDISWPNVWSNPCYVSLRVCVVLQEKYQLKARLWKAGSILRTMHNCLQVRGTANRN